MLLVLTALVQTVSAREQYKYAEANPPICRFRAIEAKTPSAVEQTLNASNSKCTARSRFNLIDVQIGPEATLCPPGRGSTTVRARKLSSAASLGMADFAAGKHRLTKRRIAPSARVRATDFRRSHHNCAARRDRRRSPRPRPTTTTNSRCNWRSCQPRS